MLKYNSIYSSSSFGDALYYINELIEKARKSSPENSAAVASLTSSDSKGAEEENSASDEIDEAARTALRWDFFSDSKTHFLCSCFDKEGGRLTG